MGETSPARASVRQGRLRRLVSLLSSWRLSVVLTISGAVYYVFLSIWGARAPAHVVQTISGMIPFLLLYLLLLVNTLLCFSGRIWRLLELAGRRSVFLPQTHTWRRVVAELPSYPGSVIQTDDGFLWVYRRGSSVGTLLLHLALFPLALGFLLSVYGRSEGSFVAGLGEQMRVDGLTYQKARPDSSSLPTFELQIADIDARFWEDRLLFTSFTADVTIDNRKKHLAINSPALITPLTTVRLTSFGYAPVYLLMVEGVPRPLEEGAIKLNLFPPGQRDYFRPRHFPHRIYLQLYPDYIEDRSGPTSRSMELNNPRFAVQVYRGKVFITEALLAPGQPLTVEEFTFSLVQVIPTVELTVVRDPGLPLIILAFLIAIVGLLLRLPGRRQEVLARERDQGGWDLSGWNIEAPP
jgi:hypothetical protein